MALWNSEIRQGLFQNKPYTAIISSKSKIKTVSNEPYLLPHTLLKLAHNIFNKYLNDLQLPMNFLQTYSSVGNTKGSLPHR